MIKRVLTASAAAAAIVFAMPVVAQEEAPSDAYDANQDQSDEDQLAEAMEGLGALFKTEPLTAEQEARLPTAKRIVGKMIPEGTMGDMFSNMMGDMLGPIMDMGPPAANMTVAKGLGVNPFALEMSEEQAEEVANLLDPAWKERGEAERAVFPDMMAKMMTAIEPGMRKAMSELYAINFNETELTEIEAFFSTETGTNFARKSFTMASDPRIMAASFEALPAIMGSFGDMEQAIKDATADLPPQRAFTDLSPTERARISELTGYSEEEIEANLVTEVAADEAAWGEDEDYLEEAACEGEGC